MCATACTVLVGCGSAGVGPIGIDQDDERTLHLYVSCANDVEASVTETAREVRIDEISADQVDGDCTGGVGLALREPLGDRALVVEGEAWEHILGGCPYDFGPADAEPSPDCDDGPTADDHAAVEQLLEFARSPSRDALALLPLDEDGVRLGLGPQLLVTRTPEELEDPQAWQLGVGGGFRGYTGPFSVLDLLAPGGGLNVTLGPHDHCASPPVDPPAELTDLRHVSAQPTVVESCLDWFTVDLYIGPDGIRGITLDLWEP